MLNGEVSIVEGRVRLVGDFRPWRKVSCNAHLNVLCVHEIVTSAAQADRRVTEPQLLLVKDLHLLLLLLLGHGDAQIKIIPCPRSLRCVQGCGVQLLWFLENYAHVFVDLTPGGIHSWQHLSSG